MPDLVLKLGEGTDRPGTSVRLTGERFKLGRSKHADLRVAGTSVSRRHCSVEYVSGRWMVRDLGSQNGLYLNGRLVRTAELRVGDELRFGETGPHLHVVGLVPDPEAPSEQETRAMADMSMVDVYAGMHETGEVDSVPELDPITPGSVEVVRPLDTPPPKLRPVVTAEAPPAPREPPRAPPVHVQVVEVRRGAWGKFALGLLLGACAAFFVIEYDRLDRHAARIETGVRKLAGPARAAPAEAAGKARVFAVPMESSYQLLALTTTSYSRKQKDRGAALDVVMTTTFVPVYLHGSRGSVQALAQTRETLTGHLGASPRDDWRDGLAEHEECVVEWSLVLDRPRPQPLAPGEVPPRTRRVLHGQGPAW